MTARSRWSAPSNPTCHEIEVGSDGQALAVHAAVVTTRSLSTIEVTRPEPMPRRSVASSPLRDEEAVDASPGLLQEGG